jgi:xylulose-5-phosphate/fructose-6-phosphate phosphoketolase
MHVHGYREEGTTTTPFDMAVLNQIDRFHLALNVLARVPKLFERAAALRPRLEAKLAEHRSYIVEVGDDPPAIRDWTWPASAI